MASLRLTYGGALVGAQRWSVGISANLTGVPTTPTGAQLTALANQLFDDFVTSAWSTAVSGTTSLRSIVGTSGNFDQVRAYFYAGGAGHALVVGASAKTPVAGTGTPNQPAQVAIVASLLSDYAGRSNRGRIYIPNRCLSSTATGNLPVGQAALIATTIANWLSLVRTRSLAGATLVPVVAGATIPPPPIVSVKVDNVADTQRRRRDKVTATETSVVPLIVG